MQLIKRVTQLAKDRALIKFTALARAMVADAESVMLQEMADGRLGGDQRILRSALDVLRQEGSGIVASMDARFRDSVDRGMRTMYTDLRQGLRTMSANTLSLIDDETVNRQLEVGHLVQRLRDACDENLGRLNIMIAQMHGDADVHERENPFRPYLVARALYETLKERVDDDELSKVLFARLSDSLAARLSDYYASICEVFDANGIQARLLARPTKLKRHQRDQLAQQLAALNSSAGLGNAVPAGGLGAEAGINPRILPALQRLFETMGASSSGDTGTEAGSIQDVAPGGSAAAQSRLVQAEEFQDFIWRMFNQAPASAESSGAAMTQGVLGPASAEMLEAIGRYQRQVVEATDAAGATEGGRNQLFALGEQLMLPQQAQGERMAIDVVAVLFAFILEDEQIPAVVRARIARLQIPFLKAALLEPRLLQQADHPARQFLNRIASAAVGLDPESAVAKRLDQEIARLVARILQDFDQDLAIFIDCLHELEQFLAEQLAAADAETARSIEAAVDAEKFSANLRHTVASLQEIMASMEVDQRVKDFIEQIWARVLVRAAAQETEGKAGLAAQYQEVLPELVWSAQEKTAPEDRSALMRMLPGLVKRLRIGMLMIHMPEDDCKSALDRLVPVHTQVLRFGGGSTHAGAAAGIRPSLDALRKGFSRLVTSNDSTAWILSDPLEIETEVLESALADRGVSADLSLASPSVYTSTPSADLLTQLQVGNCVECRAGDVSVPARLVWVSKSHSLFIFKLDQQSKPLVYSASALLQALQSGKVGLIEYAPAFDRAVDALMMGAEAVQSARP